MGVDSGAVFPAVARVVDRGYWPLAAGFKRWRLAEVSPRGGTGRYLLGVAALVAVYYGAAHLGYAFQFSGPVAAIVWLPVGVAIGFLYVGGKRFWPGVVIGDLLVNNYSALPIGSALGQSVGNLLEVLVGVALMRRLCPRSEPLATLRGVGGMVVAVVCGTFLSATVGSVSSWLGGVVGDHSVLYVWRTWWLGDLSGALIVLPLMLAWRTFPPRPWGRARVVEGAVLLAVVTACSYVQLAGSMVLGALVFPALIWAALSFGARAATVAIGIVCAFAVWGATNDLGPFGVGSINSRLLESQLFIATVSLCALAIAALVSERTQLAETVRASRARLVEAADEARDRVERDLHDGAQQGLLGLQLKLDLARSVIRSDPAEGERLIGLVGKQMDDVMSELRSLAHGVYPALLRERGVLAALESVARCSPSGISVRGESVGRYPRAIEAAVYFCCVEAIQNVAKHAGSDCRAGVRLSQRGRYLHFAVGDSGIGFDTRAAEYGHGLISMRDRVEAVAGSLTIASQPGSGTTIRGRVPTS